MTWTTIFILTSTPPALFLVWTLACGFPPEPTSQLRERSGWSLWLFADLLPQLSLRRHCCREAGLEDNGTLADLGGDRRRPARRADVPVVVAETRRRPRCLDCRCRLQQGSKQT